MLIILFHNNIVFSKLKYPVAVFEYVNVTSKFQLINVKQQGDDYKSRESDALPSASADGARNMKLEKRQRFTGYSAMIKPVSK